jgi:hypothetical protein
MVESPKVSVVIPAWRSTEFIAEAIDSVLAQDLPPYEIIVVNDGCPDSENLERVLEPYRRRDQIRYVRQENNGTSSARNTGIRLASAPFVAVVDSDDVWQSNFLSSVYGLLVSDPQIVMAYAYPVYFGHGTMAGKKGIDVFPCAPGKIATFEQFVTRQIYGSPTGVFHRQVALDIGMYTEWLRCAEDYDFLLRMSRVGKVAYIRDPPLYRCRLRDGSLTTSRDIGMWRIRALENQLLAPDLSADEVSMLNQEIAYLRSDCDFQQGRYEFVYGDRRTGLRLMTSANRQMGSSRTQVVLWLCRLCPWLMRPVGRWRDRSNPIGRLRKSSSVSHG